LTGFGRILEDLNGAGVRYVLIGGIALIRHGVVRATRDIDAVFDPDPENVNRIRSVVDQSSADQERRQSRGALTSRIATMSTTPSRADPA
jgi:hypothetical protein